MTAPVAWAKTVNLTRTFTLKSNATATYELPGKSATPSDAGYILSGPGLKVREDNLVDSFPRQEHDAGEITKGRVKVVAVGVKSEGFGFKIRVRTGELNGVYTVTLYLTYGA